MLPSEDPSQVQRLKVKEWKIIPQENGIHRKMGVVILISDKMDFKIKKVPRNQDGHFIMMNRTMHQEDITLTNTYAPNLRAPKYIKQ